MFEKERKLVNDVQLRTGYRVYLSLLRLRAASTKDVQESMKFPTTGQAKYHLKRLVDLDLAKQDDDGNFRATERKFGLLRFLFRVRNSVLPMSAFYSAFFAVLTIVLFFKAPSAEVLLLGGLITLKEVVDTYIFFSVL